MHLHKSRDIYGSMISWSCIFSRSIKPIRYVFAVGLTSGELAVTSPAVTSHSSPVLIALTQEGMARLSVRAVGVCCSNCRSHVSEHKTLSVTVSQHSTMHHQATSGPSPSHVLTTMKPRLHGPPPPSHACTDHHQATSGPPPPRLHGPPRSHVWTSSTGVS